MKKLNQYLLLGVFLLFVFHAKAFVSDPSDGILAQPTIQETAKGQLNTNVLDNGFASLNLPFHSNVFACDPPEFTLDVSCNDDEEYIMVDITIDNLGSADSVVVSDDAGSTPQIITSSGAILTFGPYPYDNDITITVANADDPDCSSSETISSDSCPPPLCVQAAPFCSGEGLSFPNNVDSGQPPVGPDYNGPNCFNDFPNPVWYFLQIGQPGAIQLTLSQENDNGIGLDVDFTMWGPFDSVEEGCQAVMDGEPPVQFSYSAATTETVGIGAQGGGVLLCDGTSTPPAGESGDVYILMILNYSNQSGTISLDQDNPDDPDAGSTDCSIVTQNQILACPGEDVALISDNTDQIAYTWFVYDPVQDEYNPLTDETSDTLVVDEGGEYKLVSYDDEGNPTSEFFTVVMSPEPQFDNLLNPETGEIEDTLSMCGIDSLMINGKVTNPDDYGAIEYHWYDQQGNQIAETPSFYVTEPGTYTLKVTTQALDQDGDPGDKTCTETLTFHVTEADFTVNLGDDQTFCGQDSYQLTAQIDGADPADASYAWSGPNGAIDNNSQNLTVTESGEYNVVVNVNGCVDSAAVNIQFIDPAQFDLGEDIVTCSLDDVVLDATPDNVGNEDFPFVYEWIGPNGPLDANGPVVHPQDYGTYTVTVYREGFPECATTHSIDVEKVEDFNVALNADGELSASFLYCENAEETPTYTITFTAAVTNDQYADGVTYTWSKNGDPLDVSGNTYSITYDTQGEYNDEITVEADFGNCSTTASLTTDVNLDTYEHPCKITEGLSPGNHDGINDKLDLTFLNDRSGIEKLEVFNRYGTKVFEQSNYTDQWHGQDDHGDALPTGTYYYILKMKNTDPVYGKVHKGWIYINQKIN